MHLNIPTSRTAKDVEESAAEETRIWTKGADSKMKPLMNMGGDEARSEAWTTVQEKLITFANVGLRCLILGSRKLENEESNDYHQKRKENDNRPDGVEKKKILQVLRTMALWLYCPQSLCRIDPQF